MGIGRDILAVIVAGLRYLPVLAVSATWFWAQTLQNALGIQVLPKYEPPTVVQQTRQVEIPSTNLEKAASTSAVLPVPSSAPAQPTQSTVNTPWGTTEKIGEHEYRTYVGNDPAMGSPEEILKALNSYRASHGQGQLQSGSKLCSLALKRAQDQDKMATLDDHKGLIEYMNDPKSWTELNITSIGENASYGYVLSGVHLIEWVFDADAEHRDNQLNPAWNLACAQTFGKTVDIIFGKR